MEKIINQIKAWWNTSTGFRHAVTTWIGGQVAVPLAQVSAWANSCASGSCNADALPNWHVVFATFWYATVAAVISGAIKWWQQRRAFPTVPPVAPSAEPPAPSASQ